MQNLSGKIKQSFGKVTLCLLFLAFGAVGLALLASALNSLLMTVTLIIFAVLAIAAVGVLALVVGFGGGVVWWLRLTGRRSAVLSADSRSAQPTPYSYLLRDHQLADKLSPQQSPGKDSAVAALLSEEWGWDK